jgi:hypothetical protein
VAEIQNKEAKQCKVNQDAQMALSEERIRQIDNLRTIHETDSDQILRLTGQVNDTNRQYQNLLQKQGNDQVLITELKRQISTRGNIIDVIRIQNTPTDPTPPSPPPPTPTIINLESPEKTQTVVKERVSQIESASETPSTPVKIPPTTTPQSNSPTPEDEEVFQDSNGHSQEVQTKIDQYLQTIHNAEEHISKLIADLETAIQK